MGHAEPCRRLVVGVGQGTFCQLFRGGFVNGQDAVGIAGDDLRLTADQVGQIEPVFTQFVQPRGGGGLDAGIVGEGDGGTVSKGSGALFAWRIPT